MQSLYRSNKPHLQAVVAPTPVAVHLPPPMRDWLPRLVEMSHVRAVVSANIKNAAVRSVKVAAIYRQSGVKLASS